MTTFKEQWLEVSGRKGTLLCAGLDPADFEMGRGEKGLPEGVDKLEWSLAYIEAVAPYCAAIKPNGQYWKSEHGTGDDKALRRIKAVAHANDLLVIDDSKLADIGDTNEAGVYFAKQRADAVTFSPFIGNLEEAVEFAHNRDAGLISMCLMTHPEFKNVKNSLVMIDEEDYDDYGLENMNTNDYKRIGDDMYVRQYIQLAFDANKFGADGIVVGAPSPKNHLTEGEIRNVARYYRKGLILVPGVGAQGGDAKLLFQIFDPRNLIINVGRDLMFPGKNNKATYIHHIEAAKQFRDMLNSLKPHLEQDPSGALTKIN